MVTGFDYLSQDKALQEHWVRRFAAIVIDALIIYAPISILFSVLGTRLFFPWFFAGGLFFLYCALIFRPQRSYFPLLDPNDLI